MKPELDQDAQKAAFDEQHRKAALEQVEWERSQIEAAGQRRSAEPASRDYERRRDSDAAS